MYELTENKNPYNLVCYSGLLYINYLNYLPEACAMSTAQATVQLTIRDIESTCLLSSIGNYHSIDLFLTDSLQLLQ